MAHSRPIPRLSTPMVWFLMDWRKGSTTRTTKRAVSGSMRSHQ
jgi:hypothetical protein